MSKIHKAARKGDIHAVAALLDGREAINSTERMTGATPLHLAAGNDHLDLMRLLIGRGADTRAQASFGTPLHWANSPASAQILLDAGVDVDVRAASGVTPLMEAARGPGKAEMVRFFLDAGADPTATSEEGESALDLSNGAEVQELLRSAGGVRHETKPERWVDASRAAKVARAVRRADAEKVRRLLAEGYPPDGGLWEALVGETSGPFAGAITDENLVELIAAGSRIDEKYSAIARMLIEAGPRAAHDRSGPSPPATVPGDRRRWSCP
jgi:uncharacterized protein